MHPILVDMGYRNVGQCIRNVVLPPWATSAEDFLVQMSAALESVDHVSAQLNR